MPIPAAQLAQLQSVAYGDDTLDYGLLIIPQMTAAIATLGGASIYRPILNAQLDSYQRTLGMDYENNVYLESFLQILVLARTSEALPAAVPLAGSISDLGLNARIIYAQMLSDSL